MRICIFVLLVLSQFKSSYFKKVLEGATLIIPEDAKLFILPVDIACIESISFDSRMLFTLYQSCNVISIFDGEVIELDYKRKYIKIKGEDNNQTIVVRYFDIEKIVVKNGEKIKKGQIIGSVSNNFSLQVRLNEVIVNLLDYIEDTKINTKNLIKSKQPNL